MNWRTVNCNCEEGEREREWEEETDRDVLVEYSAITYLRHQFESKTQSERASKPVSQTDRQSGSQSVSQKVQLAVSLLPNSHLCLTHKLYNSRAQICCQKLSLHCSYKHTHKHSHIHIYNTTYESSLTSIGLAQVELWGASIAPARALRVSERVSERASCICLHNIAHSKEESKKAESSHSFLALYFSLCPVLARSIRAWGPSFALQLSNSPTFLLFSLHCSLLRSHFGNATSSLAKSSSPCKVRSPRSRPQKIN